MEGKRQIDQLECRIAAARNTIAKPMTGPSPLSPIPKACAYRRMPPMPAASSCPNAGTVNSAQPDAGVLARQGIWVATPEGCQPWGDGDWQRKATGQRTFPPSSDCAVVARHLRRWRVLASTRTRRSLPPCSYRTDGAIRVTLRMGSLAERKRRELAAQKRERWKTASAALARPRVHKDASILAALQLPH